MGGELYFFLCITLSFYGYFLMNIPERKQLTNVLGTWCFTCIESRCS